MIENEHEDLMIQMMIEDFQRVTETPQYSLFVSELTEAFKQMLEIISEIVEIVLTKFQSIMIEIDDFYEFNKLPRPRYKNFDKTMTKAYVMQPMKKYGFGYKRKSH